MGRDKYTKDYELYQQTDARGRTKRAARYIGKYARLVLDDESARNFRLNSLLLSGGALAILVGAGCLNNDGTRTLYVVLPYIGAMLSAVLALMGAWRLPGEAKPMQTDEFSCSFLRMKRASVALVISAGAMTLGGLLFLLFGGGATPWQDAAVTALAAASAGMGWWFIRRQSRIRVETDLPGRERTGLPDKAN